MLASGAHPRVGGENTISTIKVPQMAGSSPRGRGKLLSLSMCWLYIGLIPAWAGKTSALLFVLCFLPAHPRVGGENLSVSLSTRKSVGSSPRGRGKLGLGVELANHAGLIPAWAGKTGHCAIGCHCS